jgi:hypothetical protein
MALNQIYSQIVARKIQGQENALPPKSSGNNEQITHTTTTNLPGPRGEFVSIEKGETKNA